MGFAHLQGLQEISWEQEKQEKAWEQEAISRLEDFRGFCTFENQISRFMYRVKNQLSNVLKRKPQPLPTSQVLMEAFSQLVPPGHRPAGTKIYGFSVNSGGNDLTQLTGNGLESDMGRIVGRVLAAMVFQANPEAKSLPELDRRVRNLFGPLLSFQYMTANRRGKLTWGDFRGKKAGLIWDTLYCGKQLVGCYLVVLPAHARTRSHPVAFALRQLKRGKGRRLMPMLIPLETVGSAVRPIIPPDLVRLPEAKKILGRIRAAPDRDLFAPAGVLCREIPGYWAVRDVMNMDLPWELWLLSPTPSFLNAVVITRAEVVLCLLFLPWWVWRRFFPWLDGRTLPVSMQRWFLVFFTLTGAVPLIVLYGLASVYLETVAERRIQESVQETLKTLESLDVGSRRLSTVFAQNCRRTIGTTAFSAHLKRMLSANGGDSASNSLAKDLLKELKSFEDISIPLRFFMMYPFGKEEKVFGPDGKPTSIPKSTLEFNRVELLGSVLAADGKLRPRILPAGGSIDSLVFDLVRFCAGSNIFEDFYMLKQRVYFTSILGEDLFQYFDYMDCGGETSVGILFAGRPQAALLAYLKNEFHFLAGGQGGGTMPEAENSRLLGGVSPYRRFAIGKIVPGGLDRTFATGASWSSSSEGKSLWQVMETAALLNTRKLMTSRIKTEFSGIETDQGICWIGFPSKRIPGFVLGAQISTLPILVAAQSLKMSLIAGMCLLGGMVLLISLILSGHLFLPLQQVENGLRQVAAGNLQTRVELIRQDELGDVSRAFDKMIHGLEERQQLGRFVSGNFDEALSRTQGQKESPLEDFRDGVVLVSDIRNFTTLSETHSPEDIVRMLNRHLEEMSTAIKEAGGNVDRFIGDAVVASFTGLSPEQSIDMALDASWEIMRRHELVKRERQDQGLFVYDIGVGIAAGQLLLGTFGSKKRLDHALLGQPRLEAERLEGLSKKGRYTRIVACPRIVEAGKRFSFVAIPGDSQAWEVETRR